MLLQTHRRGALVRIAPWLLLVHALLAWTGTAALAQGLELSVTATPDPVRPGETIDVAVTISNVSGSDAAIQLPIPAGVSVDEDRTAGTCPSLNCEVGELLTFDLEDLPVGSGRTYHVPAVVLSGPERPEAGTSISFEGAVSMDGSELVSDSASAVVRDDPVLELEMSEDADPVRPNQRLTYELRFGNRAVTGSAPGTLLAMPVPSGTTFVSASDGGTLVGGVVEWPIGDLSAGEGGVREITVRARDDLDPGKLLRAEATVSDMGAPAAEARARAVTRVENAPTLGAALEIVHAPARPGRRLAVALTVSNRSAVELPEVQAQLRVPDGVWVDESRMEGECSGIDCNPGERISWELDDVPPGGRSRLLVPFLVFSGPDAPRDATILQFDASVRDGAGETQERGRSALVEADPRLELRLSESADPARPDQPLTYELRFGNRALAGSASGALLRMPVPGGANFVSASNAGAVSGGVVEWPIGDLPAGEAGVLEVTLEVDPDLSPGALIRAEATIRDGAMPASEARATAVTAVEDDSPLGLDLEPVPDPVRPGRRLGVALTLSNRGPAPLSGLEVEMRVPEGVRADDVLTEGGCTGLDCTAAERVSWELGHMAAGSGRRLFVPFAVLSGSDAPRSASLLELEAFVLTDAGDTAKRRMSVPVQANPRLELRLSETEDPVTPDDQLTYELRFAHERTFAGQPTAPGAVLRMPVPAGASFVSASGAGSVSDGVVEWPIGDLAPGQGGARELTVQVDPDLDAGTLIRAEAELADAGTPAAKARASEATRTDATSPLDLALELGPDPVRPGRQLGATLVVSNRGSELISDVEVTLRVPEKAAADEALTEGNCSGLCDPNERVTWEIEELAAGSGRNLFVPIVLDSGANAARDGRILELHATALDGAGATAELSRSALTRESPGLTLAVEDGDEPVTPSETFAYELAYGNPSDTRTVPGQVLRFRLPDGVTVLSASGAEQSGRVLRWDLPPLLPGTGSRRSVAVRADADVSNGQILEGRAAITSSGSGEIASRQDVATRAKFDQPLSFHLAVPDGRLSEADRIDTQIVVQNDSASNRTDVVAELLIPEGAIPFSPDDIAGDCIGDCDPGERIEWALGTLVPGEARTLDLPLFLGSAPTAPVDGEAVEVRTWLTDAAGTEATSLRVLPVPEPGSSALALGALGSLAGLRIARGRRRRGGETSRL